MKGQHRQSTKQEQERRGLHSADMTEAKVGNELRSSRGRPPSHFFTNSFMHDDDDHRRLLSQQHKWWHQHQASSAAAAADVMPSRAYDGGGCDQREDLMQMPSRNAQCFPSQHPFMMEEQVGSSKEENDDAVSFHKETFDRMIALQEAHQARREYNAQQLRQLEIMEAMNQRKIEEEMRQRRLNIEEEEELQYRELCRQMNYPEPPPHNFNVDAAGERKARGDYDKDLISRNRQARLLKLQAMPSSYILSRISTATATEAEDVSQKLKLEGRPPSHFFTNSFRHDNHKRSQQYKEHAPSAERGRPGSNEVPVRSNNGISTATKPHNNIDVAKARAKSIDDYELALPEAQTSRSTPSDDSKNVHQFEIMRAMNQQQMMHQHEMMMTSPHLPPPPMRCWNPYGVEVDIRGVPLHYNSTNSATSTATAAVTTPSSASSSPAASDENAISQFSKLVMSCVPEVRLSVSNLLSEIELVRGYPSDPLIVHSKFPGFVGSTLMELMSLEERSKDDKELRERIYNCIAAIEPYKNVSELGEAGSVYAQIRAVVKEGTSRASALIMDDPSKRRANLKRRAEQVGGKAKKSKNSSSSSDTINILEMYMEQKPQEGQT